MPVLRHPSGARDTRRSGRSGGSQMTPGRPTPPGGARDEPACRPGSVSARLAATRSATIHLGLPLPTASCGLPASSGGPPSNAHARSELLFLTLLRVGFTEPPRSPGALVVSYTTVSPLPSCRSGTAVCFLWHCPAGHPGWALPTTLPCGARTFLGGSPRRGRPAGSSVSSLGLVSSRCRVSGRGIRARSARRRCESAAGCAERRQRSRSGCGAADAAADRRDKPGGVARRDAASAGMTCAPGADAPLRPLPR